MSRTLLALVCWCLPLFAQAGYLGARARLELARALREKDQTTQTWVARFDGDPAVLAKRAAIISHVGRVFVLQSKPQDIAALAALDGMVDLDAPVRYKTTLDVSSADLRIADAQQSLGLRGEGVLVAVIDTGLDVRHGDFRNEDGSSRVLFFLDLNQTPEESGVTPVKDPDGAVVDGLGGTVFDKALIDQFLQGADLPIPKDISGHGTHVTGIAASNGGATNEAQPAGRYVGAAPSADILFVDADLEINSFTDADLIRAIQFVTERAAKLGRPVVINLSIGGQSGPHDGSGPVEEVIDSLSGPGKEGVVFVLSAGNDGDADLHASAKLNGENDVELLVPSHLFRNGDGVVEVEIFFDDPRDLSLSVIAPDGERFGPQTPGSQGLAFHGQAGTVELSFADEGSLFHAIISLKEEEALPVLNGTWRIELKGDASRFDAWMTDSNLGTTHIVRPLDPDVRVSSLACAQGAIAVASHVNRDKWLQPDGEETQTGLIPQTISFFSSYGPSRLGDIRPDISAPGDFVLSSMSQDAPPTLRASSFFSNPSDRLVGDDGKHGALRGTSMSSPQVAGVVALLLSIDPTLDVEEVRRILWLSARADAQTTQTLPNNRWGYGKLDPFAAAQIILQGGAQQLSTERSTVGVLRDLIRPDGEDSATIMIIPRDVLGVPLGPGRVVTARVNVRDSLSNVSFGQRELTVVDEGDGVYSATLMGEAPRQFGDAPLVGDVRAQVDGIELEGVPSVSFAFSRGEIGRLGEFSGGSCQVGSESGSAVFFWIVALLSLRLRRRTS